MGEWHLSKLKFRQLYLYALKLLRNRNLTGESRCPLSFGIHVEHFFFPIHRTTQPFKPFVC